MTSEDLRQIIKRGETSLVQFKEMFSTSAKIADEMIAFANSRGGVIVFGVKDKTGEIVGLSFEQVQELSREVGNIANDQVRPTIYIQTEVIEIDAKMVLVVHVQEGKDKPYKNLAGNIWVKQGADKRRVTDNAEILSLFQQSGTYHPDEAGVNGSSYKDIDTLALDRFFENVYHKPISEFDIPQEQVLQSLHIMDEQGRLTTAGVLFFGRRPQQFFPVFVIKAVWFYGNSIAGTQYRDSRDIEGTIPEMYEQVHLDLLKTAAIRLLIFDDRVEIINPGSVVGGHTMVEVMHGNSFPRNPLMANFCAKTMPYRGLGSGIPRVLKEDSDVQFVDNKEGNQFTAIIKRPVMSGVDNTTADIVKDGGLNGGKVGGLQLTERQRAIIELIKENPFLTAKAISEKISEKASEKTSENFSVSDRTIETDIAELRRMGVLCRMKGRKKGYYEIIE